MRAALGGYFWIPCPICGRNFGGHEASGYLMISWSRYQAVCRACNEEAQSRNRLWMAAHMSERI